MKKGILFLAAIAAMTFTSCKEDAANKVKAENVEVAAERDAQDCLLSRDELSKKPSLTLELLSRELLRNILLHLLIQEKLL